jgi:hypothetical protein
MHQVASDVNKAKREPFFDAVVAEITEIVQQVTAYKKIF